MTADASGVYPIAVAKPGAGRRATPIKNILSLLALCALALVVSPDPPEDPVLAYLGDIMATQDPARVGAALALGVQAWLALSILAIAGYLAWSLAESLRVRNKRDTKRSFGRRMRDPVFALVAYLAAAGLIAGAVYGLRRLSDGIEARAVSVAPDDPAIGPSPEDSAAAESPEPIPPPTQRPSGSPAPWIRYGLLAALTGAAAGAWWSARRARARRRHGSETNALTPARAMAEGIARARKRLHVADDLRDAIISTYADMCGLFSSPGDTRPRSLTPREFAARLRSDGAGEGEISALTALFEKARYSGEPCGAADRDLAQGCLAALEKTYGGRERP